MELVDFWLLTNCLVPLEDGTVDFWPFKYLKPLEDGVGSGLPVGVLSLAAQWGGASGRASNWWSFSPFSPIIVVIIFVNIL